MTQLHFRKKERGVGNGEVALTAERDWEILSALFLIFFIGIIWWGHSVYGQIARDEFGEPAARTTSRPAGLDRAKLAETIQFFSARQAAFDLLLENPLEITGPGPVPHQRP
jgi:hypothetical protein